MTRSVLLPWGTGMRELGNKKIVAVWAGLFAAIALDTVVQLVWKSATDQVPSSAGAWDTVEMMLRQPLCYAVFALFGLQFVNWMALLKRADLSYVQPITALSLVTVTFFSYLVLHEHVTGRRVAGMLLILFGVWRVGATRHRTTPEGTKP